MAPSVKERVKKFRDKLKEDPVKYEEYLHKELTCNEKDISDIPFEDIISILPNPALITKGNRTYYEFSCAVDVYEK